MQRPARDQLLRRPRRDRIASALAVLGLHIGLAYVLLRGLDVDLTHGPDRALTVFDVTAPPPPTPPHVDPPSRPELQREAEGRAAPPALRAVPKPVVAPPPAVPLPPPPVTAVPVAAEGVAASAGAAPTPGPGTGAAGQGNGLGAGGAGRDLGSGLTAPASRLSGAIRNADYPRAAVRARAQGDVIVHLLIDARGRVAGCDVARSSGSTALDEITCRLIRERFRYRPALDRLGRPVPDRVGWRQSWWLAR